MQKTLYILIESSLIFLAVFAPVAFSAVDLWAITIMELVIFSAAFLWLSKSIVEGRLVFVKTDLNMPILAFMILGISQFLVGTITSSRLGTIYPYATRRYLFEALAYIFAFLVIINNIRSRRQINRILFSIISVGAALAVYGIIQKLARAPEIFWFRKAPETLLFYSSYFNCNYFAGYMDMMIFLSLGVFFAYLAHLDKKRQFYKFDIFEGWNSLFIFSITMMVISLFYTFSQGGIVVFLMTITLFYYIFSKKGLTKKITLVVILVSTMALAALALIWIRKESVQDYFYEILRIVKDINRYGERLPIWTRASKLITINPLSGIGLGAFQYIFPKVRSKAPVYFLRHCHNDYLELLIETGAIGFIIFLFGMGLFLKRYITLLRTRHDSYAKLVGYGCLLSAFSVFLYSFIDSNMHIGANALVFSYILGLGSVVIHNHSNRDRKEDTLFKTAAFTINNRFRKISLFLGASFVFLYMIGNVVSIGAADIYARLGEKNNDIELIKKAVRLEPSSSEYRYLLADMTLRQYQNRLGKSRAYEVAIDNLKKAIKLNPNVSRYYQRLGWAYSSIGDGKRAVEELKASQRLEPLNAFNYLILAIHYFNEATKIEGIDPSDSKAMEEGIGAYRKALSIDPALTIDRYRNFLKNYPQVKRVLGKYSL